MKKLDQIRQESKEIKNKIDDTEERLNNIIVPRLIVYNYGSWYSDKMWKWYKWIGLLW